MAARKTDKEIVSMRRSGALVAQILEEVVAHARAGASLIELDGLAERLTLESGAKPAFKGYMGYQHTLCTSVNEQVVHGIPSARVLKDGDIVGLDYGLVFEDFYGDSAITVPIGPVSPLAQRLMKATCESLYAAIDVCRPGSTLRDIALSIEKTVKPHGFGIVEDFVGHGIGRQLHEAPQVSHFVRGASRQKLEAGMTICIEPMITAGGHEIRVLPDRWTAVTMDHSLSAHFEHCILITENGPEVLTEWKNGMYASFLKEGKGS